MRGREMSKKLSTCYTERDVLVKFYTHTIIYPSSFSYLCKVRPIIGRQIKGEMVKHRLIKFDVPAEEGRKKEGCLE